MDIVNTLGSLLPPQSDPRADNYPLMTSVTPTVLITLCYVFGVCAWSKSLNLRKFKADGIRKPADNKLQWDLTRCLMIFYNFAMVLYSAVLVCTALYYARKLNYGLGCVEAPDPTDRQTDVVVAIGYAFYFSKFIEMLDTVFFLWRGRTDQVTFLHVFHHAAMPPSIWWGVKYAPGKLLFYGRIDWGLCVNLVAFRFTADGSLVP
ncbi:Elongation of very long chain fatty acids protein [Fasciola hepatica]|uniref:Elongation of very long chain fatty acids protein n=1 Tax=Fasciola hepatica TaxID=6192 RepID=A0A2H1CP67_FASHE|nr:Elongation of very long chain fatty acids protein [Fasciola hepatica]